jgi:hypothetical protein
MIQPLRDCPLFTLQNVQAQSRTLKETHHSRSPSAYSSSSAVYLFPEASSQPAKDLTQRRKDAERPSRNQMEKDRIMAGQNHAAPPLMVLPARILFLLRMILCGHDSVGLLGLPTKPSQLAHKLAYCSAEKRDPVCEPLRLRVKSSAGRTDIKMGGQENGISPYSSSLIFLSSVFFLLPSVFRPPSSPSVLFAFSAVESLS